MRLKSEIWVQAHLRVCAANGLVAVLVRRGDGTSGAIYIKVNRLDGRCDLYGPAPTGHADAEYERRFVRCVGADAVSEASIDDYLRKQVRFDPDLWVIEIEDRQGRHLLDEWLLRQ